MKLHYDLFHFKRYLLYVYVVLSFFCRLCHSYCRFFLSFYVVRIAVLVVFLSFLIVSLFFSVIFQ